MAWAFKFPEYSLEALCNTATKAQLAVGEAALVKEFLEGLIKADAAELVAVSVQPYNEDTVSECGTDWFRKATASAAKADVDAEGMHETYCLQERPGSY
eukprot:gene14952-21008_t